MITIFFCNCLFVSASLRAKLIFFVGSNTRMYHAILKSKISCGISETWQFGQMSQREWDWGADKDPSVWHKYKAKTWALDLMLRSSPTPLFHPSLLILKKFYLGKIFQVQYGIQNCYSHNWYLFYTDFVRSMR